MPGTGKKWLFMLLFFGCIIHGTRGLSEDHPFLLDRLIHLVWDPSGLVRMWTALDQLYNIASSWSGVARTLVTLPFKEARGERSHIMIKNYNRPGSRLGGDSISSHRERFAKAYSDGPEFAFTGENSLLGGKATSGSAHFPRVAFPNLHSSGVFSQNYFGMPSLYGNSFPFLGKYFPGSSTQPRDPLVFQKPLVADLVRNTGTTASFGDPYQQLTYLNKNTEENTVIDKNPDVPYGSSKVLGNFLTSLASGSAAKNVLGSQYSANFPFPVRTIFAAFHQMDSSKTGNDIPSLNSADRRHRNSKFEGSFDSGVNDLHHNEHQHEIKSPLSSMEPLLQNTNPQVRLQMALRLLKEIGESHLRRIEILENGEE